MISQPLRGLVGQSMSGGRSRSLALAGLPVVATSGSGSVTVRKNGWALIAMWGAGGGAQADPGLNGFVGGGSGGAALYRLAPVVAGQVITYAVGAAVLDADGGDSTVTLATGQVLTAGGGKRGSDPAVVTPAAGGLATGGDINRRGGNGGVCSLGTQLGETGEGSGAGAGGAGSGASGGGGGSAGLTDILADLIGAAGSAASAVGAGANAPGGGAGGGGASGSAGGPGKIIIVLAVAS